MESIWEKTCRGPARPPLYGKAQADVAVIGGGMTGILTALELQERGLQVVVAEAGHVGGGQTGRTTAKLTAQHGAIYAGLIERLGLEREDVIACGDGLNDLSMIRYAGLGVAMANAQPEVKEAADVVTLSNDEDGVAEVIEQYILNA